MLKSKLAADFRWTFQTSSWVCRVHCLPVKQVVTWCQVWLSKCPHDFVICQASEQEEPPAVRHQHLVSLLWWLWRDKKQELTTTWFQQHKQLMTWLRFLSGKRIGKTDTLWFNVAFCFNGWSAGFQRFSKM